MKEYKQTIKTINRSSFLTEQDLFLDIETLGLSPKTAPVYLIGLGHFTQEGYELIQLLAENKEEEGEVIHRLFFYLQKADRVITFNGEAFDLPFLTQRSQLYRLGFTFEQSKIHTVDHLVLDSFDILKAVRSLRRILQFAHYNQTALEDFLQIQRAEDLDGGKLISVYKAYENDADPVKEKTLLKHNAFDVIHMPMLLAMLTYRSIPTTAYSVQSFSLSEHAVEFSAVSDLILPAPLSIHKLGIHLQFRENTVKVFLPLEDGKMRYYLPNPGDYVRLKADGQLLPKALASSLPSASYEKVDAENCYQEVAVTQDSLSETVLNRYLKQLLAQLK